MPRKAAPIGTRVAVKRNGKTVGYKQKISKNTTNNYGKDGKLKSRTTKFK